jgi:hypothetical protein
MAITIKRSNLSLKTSPATPEAAAPVFTPGPELAAAPEDRPFWTPYAICALIAVLMLLGLIFMQYLEYDFYKPAFPLLTPQAAATSTAVKSAPASAPTESKPAAVAPTPGKPAAAAPAAEKAAAAAPAESKPAPAAEAAAPAK